MRVNKLYDMKANQLALLLLFLMLGAAAAQQTNSSSSVTNSGTFGELKANAEKGDAEAQFNLGRCYYNGQGVVKNYSEAVNWYRKSAEQGDGKAQCNLGVCYLSGTGVTKDAAEAVKWLRKAAEQGIAAAENGLGGCYGEGEGVLKDYVEADKWFNLASAQGYELAKTNLLEVEKSMTAEQIAEAQQLAREFTPHKDSNSSSSTSPGDPIASGTGFFITDDGYLISNYHVIKGATRIQLVTSAGLIPANVVQTDEADDIVLLKVWTSRFKITELGTSGASNDIVPAQVLSKFSALPIAASRTVALGGTVATVGFPNIGLQGFAPKLAKGEIASLSGAADDPRYFQISVPVQPGNSGGALVDELGNVIGIVSAKLDAGAALAASGALPENVNYAVKSSLLLSFLESVPDVDAKLKAPNTKDEKFEDVVKSAQDAAVLVLVY